MHKMGDEKKAFTSFKKEDVPQNIIDVLVGNEHFRESTTFGKKGLGEPEEIHILIVEDSDGKEKTFTYYNMGIHYMFFGDESLRPVFRVFSHFS